MTHDATTTEVHRANQELHRHYELGLKSLRKYPGRMRHHDLSGEARRLGVASEKLVSNVRLFCDPLRGYSKDELDRLCELCRKHRVPLGLAKVNFLLTVPRSERAKVQREAIVHRWSTDKFRSELKKRFGKRRDGGRMPPAPADVDDAYVQLAALCNRWQRWRSVIPSPIQAKIPRDIRKTINDIDATMKELERLVTGRLPQTPLSLGSNQHSADVTPSGINRSDARFILQRSRRDVHAFRTFRGGR